MFDTYRRNCPRCDATLAGDPVFCRSCRHLLPRRLSRWRRVLENSLAAVVATGLLGFYVQRTFLSRETVVETSKVAKWEGSGPEPAARAWAVRIEGSLKDVCTNTYARYTNKKVVLGMLERHLASTAVAANSARAPLAPEHFTADEQREALSFFRERDQFLGQCLTSAYQAIAPCEQFKDDLGGKEAAACMVPRVLRQLAVAPYVWCAGQAKESRVRSACELAAKDAEAFVSKG